MAVSSAGGDRRQAASGDARADPLHHPDDARVAGLGLAGLAARSCPILGARRLLRHGGREDPAERAPVAGEVDPGGGAQHEELLGLEQVPAPDETPPGWSKKVESPTREAPPR